MISSHAGGMKILLIGEASFVHNTLQREFRAMGHTVTLMSDGNDWHNSPRDIDLRRNLDKGKWGGLKVLFRLIRALPTLRGYDIVQINNPNCIPLRLHWIKRLLNWLCRDGAKLVMGCFGDDPQVIKGQLKGVLSYCDVYWSGQPQMLSENAERIVLNLLPEVVEAHQAISRLATCLVPCLFEYHKLYDFPPYSEKLCFLPLPITLNHQVSHRPKGTSFPIRVLVGIQQKRDYMKGASVIASWLEQVAEEAPDKLEIQYATDVPYEEYCKMLEEADVMVDQLYSYTPAMNALAAMARGTVVIGGGEEAYYQFIGEKVLRPIINVRPDSPEENLKTLRMQLLTPGRVADLSSQSLAFVEKYHDSRCVAQQYEALYRKILDR